MPQIGDFPECTCATSNVCFIHKPSGAPLGSDKVSTSVFIVVEVEYNPDDAAMDSWSTEIVSAHITLEGAKKAVEDLVKKNSIEYGDPYDEVSSEEPYLIMWESDFGHYIAIQEKTLQE